MWFALWHWVMQAWRLACPARCHSAGHIFRSCHAPGFFISHSCSYGRRDWPFRCIVEKQMPAHFWKPSRVQGCAVSRLSIEAMYKDGQHMYSYLINSCAVSCTRVIPAYQDIFQKCATGVWVKYKEKPRTVGFHTHGKLLPSAEELWGVKVGLPSKWTLAAVEIWGEIKHSSEYRKSRRLCFRCIYNTFVLFAPLIISTFLLLFFC